MQLNLNLLLFYKFKGANNATSAGRRKDIERKSHVFEKKEKPKANLKPRANKTSELRTSHDFKAPTEKRSNQATGLSDAPQKKNSPSNNSRGKNISKNTRQQNNTKSRQTNHKTSSGSNQNGGGVGGNEVAVQDTISNVGVITRSQYSDILNGHSYATNNVVEPANIPGITLRFDILRLVIFEICLSTLHKE